LNSTAVPRTAAYRFDTKNDTKNDTKRYGALALAKRYGPFHQIVSFSYRFGNDTVKRYGKRYGRFSGRRSPRRGLLPGRGGGQWQGRRGGRKEEEEEEGAGGK
jgi:hypothetical protein